MPANASDAAAHLASASGPLKSYLEYRWVKTSNDDPNVIYSPL